MVPEGWRAEKLKNLLNGGVKNGYSPIASEQETGYWVLGLGALRDDGINPLEIKPVEPTDKVRGALLSSGDFLVSRSNTPDKVGRSIMYKGEVPQCSYPDLMMRFRVDPRYANPEFIEHNLKSSSVRRYFKNSAAGSSGSMVKINKGVLENTPISLPPLPEQKKIAQILSTWDQAITATERLLENSQQRKKGLMQQLLTGKKRLPGFEGEWETTKVGKICKLGAGQSAPQGQEFFDKGIHDFLRVSDIGSSVSRFAPPSRDKINDRAVEEKRLNKVPAGATLFTKSGASLLLNQRAQLQRETYIVSHLGFAHGAEFTDDDFVYYLFCLIDFGKIAAGTSLPALQLSTLSQIKVTVPTQKQEQKAISQILGLADQEIEDIQKRLSLLKQEKNALMQQLLTGKRRVQVEAA